jgi:D-alanyl-lipoteichoic acid acyltransferase DltB (MBOAT superfamily)
MEGKGHISFIPFIRFLIYFFPLITIGPLLPVESS